MRPGDFIIMTSAAQSSNMFFSGPHTGADVTELEESWEQAELPHHYIALTIFPLISRPLDEVHRSRP